MEKGDTPEAACFNSPEETNYRTPLHTWKSLIKPEYQGKVDDLQVCQECGAMRKVSVKP